MKPLSKNSVSKLESNVYVANTTKNGARNCDGAGGDNNDPHDECHININAHIVAFKESFATHYWQNTYTQGANNDF